MRTYSLLTLLLTLLLAPPALRAQTTYVWTADGNNDDWENPANWFPTAVPLAGDNAAISWDSTPGIVDVNGTNLGIAALSLDVGSNRGFFGAGNLTAEGPMFWKSGGWHGSGTLTLNGGLQLTGLSSEGDGYYIGEGTVVNADTATWASASWGASIANVEPQLRNEGVFSLTPNGDEYFCFASTPDFFVNAASGTVRHTTARHTMIACPFSNDGLVLVEEGTLELSGWGGVSTSHAGDFVAEPGADFVFANRAAPQIIEPTGSLTAPLVTIRSSGGRADLTVEGVFDVDTLRAEGSVLLAFDGPTTLSTVVMTPSFNIAPILGGSASYSIPSSFTWERGSFGGTGTTTVPLDLTLDGNAGSRLLRDARTLRLTGATTWTNAASVYAFDADTRTVNAGTMRLVGPASTRNWGNFLNEGTLVSEDGFNQYTAFTNRGTVRVEGGETRPAAALDGPDTGRYEVASDGYLNFAGTRTLAVGAEVAGTGLVNTPSTVTNNAWWQPGGLGTVGVLRMAEDFTLGVDGLLEIDLGGYAPGTEYDQLDVTGPSGSAVLDGTLRVRLLDGFVPQVGDRFLIVPTAAASGSFAYLKVQVGIEDAYIDITDEGVELVIGMPVANESDEAALPAAFALHAAYPNPFNPSTTLRFDVPEASLTRLAVYDALGREVAVLLDGQQAAGTHAATLDARGLPSGVYLVRMTAEGGFAQTRRLTLLR